MTPGTKHTRVKAIFELPPSEQRTWMIVQLLDGQGTWTITDVALFAGDRPNVVHNYVARLEKAGFVKRVGKAAPEAGRHGNDPHLFEVVRKSVEAPRISRDGTLMPERQNQRIWRTMRMLKEFTIPELAGYASAAGDEIKVTSLRTYCAYLKRAGVIEDLGRTHHRGPKRLKLAKKLGPRAPRILTANVVYDANAKATVGIGDSREARS
ncbi:hypothetical protein FP2506_11562 [Fulvimarina pelagi HTCC2506]|uniref:Uncharacterized protein n=1 Tax=Fulvimarina pelagi HTCC2506 TaxID=314231 RepID=Q0FYW7_9HYPH|nr:hypothetical protein [Fulvimarina pelagi]EAU40191.1 hypothetical protein FP2506_11562 [Fulvimarina pelagi HTCC2506]